MADSPEDALLTRLALLVATFLEQRGVPLGTPATSPTDGRKQARHALGVAAVLPVSEAIELMPLQRPDAREFLRSNGLIHYLQGRPCVIWGDVLEALRKSSVKHPAQPAEKPKPRVRLGRTPL